MSDHLISPDDEPHHERVRLSRRDLLKRSAGALAAAVAGPGFVETIAGQVTGTTPDGGTVSFRLPMCARPELDRREYIHNLEIHARIKASGSVGTDGVTSPLWVRGQQRLLPSMGLDITDPREPTMAIKPTPGGCLAYATHLKKWIVVNSGFTSLTAPNPQYPRGQYHPSTSRKPTAPMTGCEASAPTT